VADGQYAKCHVILPISGWHSLCRTIESNVTTVVLGVKIGTYFFAILVPFSMPIPSQLQ
jgi:hypothetical protein